MLVDVAKEHGLFIIGDEAYREFVYAGEPLQSMGQFADAAENVIVIDTVSKRFSACGARIGCLITRNRELMAHAMKYASAACPFPPWTRWPPPPCTTWGRSISPPSGRSISAAGTP